MASPYWIQTRFILHPSYLATHHGALVEAGDVALVGHTPDTSVEWKDDHGQPVCTGKDKGVSDPFQWLRATVRRASGELEHFCMVPECVLAGDTSSDSDSDSADATPTASASAVCAC